MYQIGRFAVLGEHEKGEDIRWGWTTTRIPSRAWAAGQGTS